jgi:hypothetical protein
VFDLISDLEVAGSSKLGVTIMRTHLYLQTTGLAVSTSWQVGLSITRSQDIGGGAPSPVSAPDIDWMLNSIVYSTFSGATVDANVVTRYDVRSKRKCEEMGDTYAISLVNGGAPTAVASVFARTLLALP